MIRRKRPRSLTDYRRVLDSQGEIVIGAYAEHQRRRRIVIGLFGVALIVLAAWFYVGLRPGSPAGAGRYAVAVQCVNEECGRRAVLRVKPGDETYPMVCPYCGNRSCYKLWACRNPECGHVFLHRGEPDDLRCPRCGSRTVGTAEDLPPEVDVE